MSCCRLCIYEVSYTSWAHHAKKIGLERNWGFVSCGEVDAVRMTNIILQNFGNRVFEAQQPNNCECARI